MKIEVLFTNHNTFTSELITLFTNSKFSHTSILFDNNLIFESDLSKKGVIITDYNNFNKDVSFKESFIIEVDEYNFRELMINNIGKSYDLTAIFSFILKRNWQEDDSWFCSELTAYVLQELGIIKFDKKLNKISPGLLYEKLKDIYL